ncbi:hypothetical protein KCV07_g119, partial [Aureobasidium melanogenum]
MIVLHLCQSALFISNRWNGAAVVARVSREVGQSPPESSHDNNRDESLLSLPSLATRRLGGHAHLCLLELLPPLVGFALAPVILDPCKHTRSRQGLTILQRH